MGAPVQGASIVVLSVDDLRRILREELQAAQSGRADDLVDRRTAGISARLWDRMVAAGSLAVMRDGRRYVARRGDVLRALEAHRVEPSNVEPVTDDFAAATAPRRLRAVGGRS
jgi:hypothetical protein